MYHEDGGDEQMTLQSFVSVIVVTITARRRKTEIKILCNYFIANDVTILRFTVKAWKFPDDGKQFEATKFTAHVVQRKE